MRFYDKLYVGESIKKPERVKWKLRVAAGQFEVYLITLAKNTEDQLECFHNGLLKQRIFRKQDFYVIGIAGSYEEALSLIRQITQECVEATGTANLKAFLLDESL